MSEDQAFDLIEYANSAISLSTPVSFPALRLCFAGAMPSAAWLRFLRARQRDCLRRALSLKSRVWSNQGCIEMRGYLLQKRAGSPVNMV